jgi:2-C-methyl-D-erythritol 4-phosphate cytidylyltransferase
VASPLQVVVVAGGAGTRIGGDLPKQFREIAGRPLLVHALLPFEDHPEVEGITVVLPAGLVEDWTRRLNNTYGLGKIGAVVAGGARRSDSVRAGLAAAFPNPPDSRTLVAVHDGARPGLTRELLERVVTAARLTGAAVPVLPMADTVAVAAEDPEGELWQGHLERTGLRQVQTPQVFWAHRLLQAHQGAPVEASDDAQLVHARGWPIRMVAGDPANLKVTTAADLELVRRLLTAGQP